MRRDKATSGAKRDDEAHEAFVGVAGRLCREQVDAARLLARLQASRHFVFCGCASIGEYGERHGISVLETLKLAAAGRAIERCPDLEERMLAGRVTLDAAAAYCRVLEEPALAAESDEYLKLAEVESARDFRRRVRRRMAELRNGGPVVTIALDLSIDGKENLERARVVASRRERRTLGESETVEIAVDHYLETFDVERKTARKRRAPPTSQTAGRYVPAEVKRKVRARRGQRCAVPGCPNEIWLEFAHRQAHADGGDREAGNLHLLCRFHHDLLHAELMTVEGAPDNPVFRDVDGRIIGARGPP